jgi:hypothetical protein
VTGERGWSSQAPGSAHPPTNQSRENFMQTNTAEICRLNDAFRTTLTGGRLILTRGIAGRPDTNAILERVRSFAEFDEDNDPHREHDFGGFEHAGATIFWKIDCYDSSMINGSEDPADPKLTTRVLTVMLAEEY